MPKRPTNGDDKNIQLELIPTERTKSSMNARDITRANFKKQAILVNKLYTQIEAQLNNNQLTIDEIKKAGDLMRNLGIWNKNYWEGMSMVEQAEAEQIIALGGDVDFSTMSDEELREWI